MNTCMIAAPTNGSGKTTTTMGLLRALKNRGLDVCGDKTSPDYIDRAFLEAAADKPGGATWIFTCKAKAAYITRLPAP